MNAYRELRDRQQEEVNAFPMMFAFSQKQFDEGMEKLGLKPTDTDKIYRFGNTGGYYRKTDSKALRDMLERHAKEIEEAIAADKTGEGFIYDMFNYELANHEYCVTLSVEDTLNALGLTLEEVNADARMKKALAKAKKRQSCW